LLLLLSLLPSLRLAAQARLLELDKPSLNLLQSLADQVRLLELGKPSLNLLLSLAVQARSSDRLHHRLFTRNHRPFTHSHRPFTRNHRLFTHSLPLPLLHPAMVGQHLFIGPHQPTVSSSRSDDPTVAAATKARCAV